MEKNRFFLLRRIFISIQGDQQGTIFRIYSKLGNNEEGEKAKSELHLSNSSIIFHRMRTKGDQKKMTLTEIKKI